MPTVEVLNVFACLIVCMCISVIYSLCVCLSGRVIIMHAWTRATTVTLHSCGQTRVSEENETAEDMSYKEKGRSNKNRLLNEGR